MARAVFRRRSPRLCLILTAAVAVLPRAVSGQTSHTLPPPAQQQLARDILKELVEINTVGDSGATPAAEALARRLKAGGFPAADVTLAGPKPKKQNLVVRLRGQGTKKPVLFIAHLDVVEARPEDWSVDPFKLTERDGYFYGRGTFDIKDEAADLIANLLRLKREGYVPQRDIIVALTDDEEGGDDNGAAWLTEHRPDLIRAAYVINTDAGGAQMQHGQRLRNPVQTSEKLYASYQLEVTGPGGHSSLPTKNNPIYTLARGLDRLSHYDFPVRLTATTRTFFQRLAGQATDSVARDLGAVTREPPDPQAVKRLSTVPMYNSSMRNTCVATMLEAGHAENALPQRARATVQCRLLPGDTPEQVRDTLIRVLADSSIHITQLGERQAAPESPLSPEVMVAVERVTRSMWPGVIVLPVMDPWSSDGRRFRLAGYPVYGISGVFYDIDDVRAHGKDERVSIQSFYEGVEFMYRLMKELTSLTAQTIPARDDSRHSLLRGVWLGLLPAHNAVPATQAGKVCVQLPKDEESEEIQGPHGYTWTSVYTAEDSSRGAGARDTATEEEVVLFKTASPGGLIPVWHGRFETGDYAIWRSVTPELAPARGGALLSVMQCVNGTGGCSQEFLLRHPDGRWFPVWQAWLDQLPRDFEGRIRHGVRIDPKTLRGEAGIVHLTVRGDSLVLLRHAVRPAPSQ